MKFIVIEETFGKETAYSNNPKVDMKCIVERMKEFTIRGDERHVVFIGEGHDNNYDTERRKLLIAYLRTKGPEKFTGGVPKIVSERFGNVEAGHVHLKEPNLAYNLPKEFCKLRKHSIVKDEERALGVLTENEKHIKLSGPGSQSRNQWFAFAIMKTILDTADRPVPIVVVCGDDHEKFLREALIDLANMGEYHSGAEIVWHHFPSAPETVQPKDEVPMAFKFSTDGKTPAGYISGRQKDLDLLLLESGIIKERMPIEVAAPYMISGPCWALFFSDDTEADEIRTECEKRGSTTTILGPETPVRILKVAGPKELAKKWPFEI